MKTESSMKYCSGALKARQRFKVKKNFHKRMAVIDKNSGLLKETLFETVKN